MNASPWFDREEILALLQRRVEGFLAGYRQNVALLGPEAIGKTTLVKRFLQEEPAKSPSLVPVFLELRPEESVSEWADRFIQALFHGYCGRLRSAPPPASLDGLLEACSGALPKTVSSARRLLALAEAGKDGEVYDLLWDLPSTMTQEAGLSCLLILDEFHHLQSFPVKNPVERLGRKIMVQSMTMYLVTSSQPAAVRAILREGLNLLFGQFEIIEVGPLDLLACRRAIRAVLSAGGGSRFLEHLIMELSQGYPGCLDLLLRGLMNSRFDEAGRQEETLLDLLGSLLLEPGGALRVLCEERIRSLPTHRSRRFWIQVLLAVAGGSHRISEISKSLDRSSSQVSSTLRCLEQVGLVSREGALYWMTDRLFQLWMVAVYPALQGAALADPSHVRGRFREVAHAWITMVQETVRKPVEEQSAALIRSWDGETVRIEGRRTLLPKFDRVEQIPGPTGRTVLAADRAGQRKGRSAGRSWLVIPWSGFMSESKARSLAADFQKDPAAKMHRKLVLGAYPVEINARLILQEARMPVWDLSVLNHLFDLYGFVRIPLPEVDTCAGGETVSIFWELASPVSTGLRAEQGR